MPHSEIARNLATASWSMITDRQKLIIIFKQAGVAIDREGVGWGGNTSIWAAGRKFTFDDDGAIVKVQDYAQDGRIGHRMS